VSKVPEEDVQQETPPALFFHSKKTYDAMLAEATEVTFDNDATGIVYEGKLTELIMGKLFLSNPYYSAITRALKKMGCIRQLRRGGGTAPSQWELITDPTPELYFQKVGVASRERQVGTPRTTGPRSPVQQQINDLNRRLQELTDKFEVLIAALPDDLITEESD
jgi:hypothetical protein